MSILKHTIKKKSNTVVYNT